MRISSVAVERITTPENDAAPMSPMVDGRNSEAPTPRFPAGSDSASSSDDDEEEETSGKITTKAGIDIDRKSAGNLKRSKEEAAADPETENNFGYTDRKQ